MAWAYVYDRLSNVEKTPVTRTTSARGAMHTVDRRGLLVNHRSTLHTAT